MIPTQLRSVVWPLLIFSLAVAGCRSGKRSASVGPPELMLKVQVSGIDAADFSTDKYKFELSKCLSTPINGLMDKAPNTLVFKSTGLKKGQSCEVSARGSKDALLEWSHEPGVYYWASITLSEDAVGQLMASASFQKSSRQNLQELGLDRFEILAPVVFPQEEKQQLTAVLVCVPSVVHVAFGENVTGKETTFRFVLPAGSDKTPPSYNCSGIRVGAGGVGLKYGANFTARSFEAKKDAKYDLAKITLALLALPSPTPQPPPPTDGVDVSTTGKECPAGQVFNPVKNECEPCGADETFDPLTKTCVKKPLSL